MVRSKFLLTLVLSVFVFASFEIVAVANSCSATGYFVGTCSGAQSSPSSVRVTVTTTIPGSAVTLNRVTTPARKPAPAPVRVSRIDGWSCARSGNTAPGCRSVPAPPPPPPAPVVVYRAPITLSDLAQFSPQRSSLVSQPSGWSLVGMPVNFIAPSVQHSVSGSLLGRVAEVRFTPRGYVWSFGDGSTRVTSSGGSTWQSLGVAEFTPTATSHSYSRVGTYTVQVVTRYTAEYRYAGGAWVAVSGEVSEPGSALSIRVLAADTVLTTGSCGGGGVLPGC
jgi:hypothetical protein